MNFEITEAFIWNLNNFFQIASLTDENKYTRLACTLFVKSAAVWIQKFNYNMTNLKWLDLHAAL